MATSYGKNSVRSALCYVSHTLYAIHYGGNNQNLMLFIRGKAISGAPSISGTNQFPNPPIIIGITIKKIITNACAVTITL
jgi:hypothetical protein